MVNYGVGRMEQVYKVSRTETGVEREGETERDKKRERDVLHSLVHSPKWTQRQGWARSKSGAWYSIWVFHMDVSAHVLGPSSPAFVGTLAGNWIRSEAARCQKVAY